MLGVELLESQVFKRRLHAFYTILAIHSVFLQNGVKEDRPTRDEDNGRRRRCINYVSISRRNVGPPCKKSE